MALARKRPRVAREQSEHVLYEIQMFYALLRYFESGEVDRAVAALDGDGLPVRNAVIESFEIHARQLIEFLTEQRGPRLSTAGDFTRGRWKMPPEREELRRLADDFSERVGHLGWKRSEFSDQEREVLTHEIEARIKPVLLRFLNQVDNGRVCGRFRDDAHRATTGSDVGERVQRGTDILESVTRAATTRPIQTNAGTATQGLRSTHDNVRDE